MRARVKLSLRALAWPWLLGLGVAAVGCQHSTPPPRTTRTHVVPAPVPGTRHRVPAAPRRLNGPPRVPSSQNRSDSRLRHCDSASAKARFRGEVSYYSDSLAGRKTASGEPYAPELPTAAHRTLPFGTVLRLVDDASGRVSCVRVNDRGPFVRGRVLDVSRAAADDLGILQLGVARVRVEVVEYGPPPKARARRVKKKRRH